MYLMSYYGCPLQLAIIMFVDHPFTASNIRRYLQSSPALIFILMGTKSVHFYPRFEIMSSERLGIHKNTPLYLPLDIKIM